MVAASFVSIRKLWTLLTMCGNSQSTSLLFGSSNLDLPMSEHGQVLLKVEKVVLNQHNWPKTATVMAASQKQSIRSMTIRQQSGKTAKADARQPKKLAASR
jgi:hypothetical protein